MQGSVYDAVGALTTSPDASMFEPDGSDFLAFFGRYVRSWVALWSSSNGQSRPFIVHKI